MELLSTKNVRLLSDVFFLQNKIKVLVEKGKPRYNIFILLNAERGMPVFEKIKDILKSAPQRKALLIKLLPLMIAVAIIGILLTAMALIPMRVQFHLDTADSGSAALTVSVSPKWKNLSDLTYSVHRQSGGESIDSGTIEEREQLITLNGLEAGTAYRIVALRKGSPVSEFTFSTLAASELPEAPTVPSAPTDPTEESTVPTEPSVPTAPTESTGSTTPSEPVDPTDPTNPTDPTDPTTPTDSTEPSEPTEPTVPVDAPTTGAIQDISVNHDALTPPEVTFFVDITAGNDDASIISKWALYAGQDTAGEVLQSGEFNAGSYIQIFYDLERGWYTVELKLYRVDESGEEELDSQVKSILVNAFEPVNPVIIDGVYRADAAGTGFYISTWNMELDDIWLPDPNDYGTLNFSWRIMRKDRTAVYAGETTFDEMEAANGIMFPDDLPFGQYHVSVDMFFVNEAGTSTLLGSAVSDDSFDVFQTRPVNLPENVTVTVSEPGKAPALCFNYDWTASVDDAGTMVGGEWFLENDTHGLFDYGTITFDELGAWIPTDALSEGENEITISFYPLYETPVPAGGTTVMWLNEIAVTITVTVSIAPVSNP